MRIPKVHLHKYLDLKYWKTVFSPLFGRMRNLEEYLRNKTSNTRILEKRKTKIHVFHETKPLHTRPLFPPKCLQVRIAQMRFHLKYAEWSWLSFFFNKVRSKPISKKCSCDRVLHLSLSLSCIQSLLFSFTSPNAIKEDKKIYCIFL